MKIKGLFVSPDNNYEFKTVDSKNFIDEVKDLFGIDSPLTVVERKIAGKYYDLWIDDEGLFKTEKDGSIKATAVCTNANEILAGGIFICRHKGEEVASLTNEDFERILYSDCFFVTNQDTLVTYDTNIGKLLMKFSSFVPILNYEV